MTQETTNGVSRRARNLDVAARFQAVDVVHPFLASFEGWNKRAARVGALFVSHAATGPEKVRYREELVALGAEVQRSYDQFRAAVADQPRHGRIDDVEHAFNRILSALEAATAAQK